MPSYHPWTPTTALLPLLSHTLAILYTLYIFAHPPRHRCLAFLLLCAPVWYAFTHHVELTPWYAVNDTVGRMLYIWLAYVSYAFVVVGVVPALGRGRWRWAGKVLFTRNLGEYYTLASICLSSEEEGGGEKREQGGVEPALQPALQPASSTAVLRRRRELPHHLTTSLFCARHLVKAVLFHALNHAFDTCFAPPAIYPPPSFFRRLPSSLSADELKLRAPMTWDVCIGDMLYFEMLYSVFAVLWVGAFRFDDAQEWSLSLFGNLADCTTVRRYWGVYWHDFIGASFTAHIKLITRSGLGMRKSAARRVLENGLVFGLSGLMHSLVRYVQTDGHGEVWTVAVWYAAQTLPVVIEEMVQHVWLGSRLRRRLQALFGEGMLMRAESAVGYVWVFCWMFWSVSKYLLTRHAWELGNLQRKYPELFVSRRERVNIDLEGWE